MYMHTCTCHGKCLNHVLIHILLSLRKKRSAIQQPAELDTSISASEMRRRKASHDEADMCVCVCVGGRYK